MTGKGFSYGIAGVAGMAIVIATILMNVAVGQTTTPATTTGPQSDISVTSGNTSSNATSNTRATVDP
jgi:hypothetical protein